jgi:hypothetical protein
LKLCASELVIKFGIVCRKMSFQDGAGVGDSEGTGVGDSDGTVGDPVGTAVGLVGAAVASSQVKFLQPLLAHHEMSLRQKLPSVTT